MRLTARVRGSAARFPSQLSFFTSAVASGHVRRWARAWIRQCCFDHCRIAPKGSVLALRFGSVWWHGEGRKDTFSDT